MRRYRDDDRESAGFELAGLLCVVAATAIAFFVHSGRTDEPAHVEFIDPAHAGAAVSGEITAAVAPANIVLPAMAPTPDERPPRHADAR